MISFKVNINILLFLMFSLGIALFAINHKTILFLRPVDIIFILVAIIFLFSNPKINKNSFMIFLLIVFIFIVSNVYGLIQGRFFDLLQIVFFYKYILIFMLPWIVVSIVKTNKQIMTINWLLLINFILLSSWTYIYFYLLKKDIIIGDVRPSFPFSSDYNLSDAHLYSSYLAFFLIAYIFYLRKSLNINPFFSYIIILNGIIGIFLTGSRTGVVSLSIALLFYSFYFILKVLTTRNKFSLKRVIIFLGFLLLIFCLFMFLIPYIEIFLNNFQWQIQRALNFDLANDESSLLRINMLSIALSDSYYSYFLLGSGFYSSLLFYDGLFPILIAHGGLIFMILIFLFYFISIKKLAKSSINKKGFLVFLLLTLVYLVSNLITEYIFVSRNAIPVLTLLSILYVDLSRKERKNCE